MGAGEECGQTDTRVEAGAGRQALHGLTGILVSPTVTVSVHNSTDTSSDSMIVAATALENIFVRRNLQLSPYKRQAAQ